MEKMKIRCPKLWMKQTPGCGKMELARVLVVGAEEFWT